MVLIPIPVNLNKQCIYYWIFMILFQDFLKILKRCEQAFEMLSLVIHVDMLKVIILFRSIFSLFQKETDSACLNCVNFL